MKKTNDYNKSLSGAKQLQKLYKEGYDFVEEGYFQKLRVNENGEKVYEFLKKTLTNYWKNLKKYQTELNLIHELASPNSDVSNLEFIIVKSQTQKEFVDCIIAELQNKIAFVKSASKEKEIELLKGLIKANKRIIELTDNRKEKDELIIKNEDLRTILKSLKPEYDRLCKYADVYKYANEIRRNGRTLDFGLQEGVKKCKDSNIHIQNLLSKNKNLKDVIDYLHNSYYKTKYRYYNEF